MTQKIMTMAMALLLAGCLTAVADGFRHPAREIEEITMASPLPTSYFSPDFSKAVMGYRFCRQVPIAELAASEARIGGLRVDPRNFSETRENYFDRLELLDVATGVTVTVQGLPADPRVKFVTWSPSGRYVAFTLSFKESPLERNKKNTAAESVELIIETNKKAANHPQDSTQQTNGPKIKAVTATPTVDIKRAGLASSR